MTDPNMRSAIEEWQSFETAPKDGRRFIAYAPEATFPITLAHRKNTGWISPDMDNAQRLSAKEVEFTHWMPLPEPPVKP